jgi:hypothetical protein
MIFQGGGGIDVKFAIKRYTEYSGPQKHAEKEYIFSYNYPLKG